MKKHTKWLAGAALTVTMLFAAGCDSNEDKAKQSLQTLLANQQTITSYTFEGSADVKLDIPLTEQYSDMPMSSALLASLQKSTLSWEGGTDHESKQYESSFRLMTGGTEQQIEVSIQNEQLYFHLPLINTEDEFVSIQLPSSPISNESNWGFGLEELTESWDSKWFTSAKSDDKTKESYDIEITSENWSSVSPAIAAYLANFTSSLTEANGWTASIELPNETAWQSALSELEITEPGLLSLRFEEEALTGITFKLYFKTAQSANQWIDIVYDIKAGKPTFDIGTPEKIKPIEQILSLIPYQ